MKIKQMISNECYAKKGNGKGNQERTKQEASVYLQQQQKK